MIDLTQPPALIQPAPKRLLTRPAFIHPDEYHKAMLPGFAPSVIGSGRVMGVVDITAPSGVSLYASSHSSSSTSFASVALGTAAADRYMYFLMGWEGNSTRTINSVTAAGAACQAVTSQAAGGTVTAVSCQIWRTSAPLTTGTTATVAVAYNGTVVDSYCYPFRVVGAYDGDGGIYLAHDTIVYGTGSGNTFSGNIDVEANGGILAGMIGVGGGGGATVAWTGVTETLDTYSAGNKVSAGAINLAAAEANRAVSAVWTVSGAGAIAAVSISP